jgi:hypothetical protein
MKKFNKSIDHNLQHVETRHKRETKSCKKREDKAFINGHSSHPECYDLEHDKAQMSLDTLAAIIKALKGPKYEDTKSEDQTK